MMSPVRSVCMDQKTITILCVTSHGVGAFGDEARNTGEDWDLTGKHFLCLT